ncbi:hypothetical protein [Brucella pseudogrignonensis]|uniref:hypothetical protein n=1 Tax=Brucella pseudogrignonensis TaxID=419475 RepID=UPI003ECD43BD
MLDIEPIVGPIIDDVNAAVLRNAPKIGIGLRQCIEGGTATSDPSKIKTVNLFNEVADFDLSRLVKPGRRDTIRDVITKGLITEVLNGSEPPRVCRRLFV